MAMWLYQMSAPSGLDFWVEFFEFYASVIDLELPIDAALFGGGFVGPGSDFGLEKFEFSDAAVGETLTGQATQFAFRHVEPTSVLGRVNEVQSADIFPGLLGREGFVEGPLRVRVEVVADQRHRLAVGVLGVQ